MDIWDLIIESIQTGTVIPKPEARSDFRVHHFGMRRGEEAMVYTIPNNKNASKPYQKGITRSEFKMAFDRLQSDGHLTRKWWAQNLSDCAKEGGCNFTTIGGIFEILGKAAYDGRNQGYRLL